MTVTVQAVTEALQAMGHDARMSGGQGQAHSIMVDPTTGEHVAVPDPRSTDAGAAGE